MDVAATSALFAALSQEEDGVVRASIHASLKALAPHSPHVVLREAVKALDAAESEVARCATLGALVEVMGALGHLENRLMRQLCQKAAAGLDSRGEEAERSIDVMGEAVKVWPGVIAVLLEQFRPGELPPAPVLRALAAVAGSNPPAFVDKFDDIFARLLPLLGAITRDSHQQLVAQTVSTFCEAVLNCAADGRCKPDEFHSEIFTTFELLLSNWLLSRDSAARNAAAEAIGNLSLLLSRDVFDSNLEQMVLSMLDLIRRDRSPLGLLAGLCTVLRRAAEEAPARVEPLVLPLLEALHPMASKQSAKTSPETIRLSSEILRAFSLVAQARPDPVVSFLLLKLERGEFRAKVTTCQVLRHLVNTQGDMLVTHGFRDSILTAVVNLLDIRHHDVLSAIVQLTVGLARAGFLTGLNLQKLMAFIVDRAALSDEAVAAAASASWGWGAADGTLEDIRQLCRRSLTALSSCAEDVVWPHLFVSLTAAENEGALPLLCKMLAQVAQRRVERGESAVVDFDGDVNLPSSSVVFARLFVCAAAPDSQRALRCSALLLLKLMAPSIDGSMPDVLTAAGVDAMLSSPSTTTDWQERVVNVMAQVLAAAGERFAQVAGDALGEQLASCSPMLKPMCYRALGLSLGQITHRDVVRKAIKRLLSDVDARTEADAAAAALGLIASGGHHELTLDEVVAELKTVSAPRGGFFSFGGGMSEAEKAERQALLLNALGYIAKYTEAEALGAALDTLVTAQIIAVAKTAKAPALRCAVAHASLRAAQAAAGAHDDGLQYRNELVALFLDFVVAEKTTATDRALFMQAIAALVALSPPLSSSLSDQLVAVLLPSLNDASTAGEGAALLAHRVDGAICATVEDLLRSFDDAARDHADNMLDGLRERLQTSDARLRRRTTACCLYILRNSAALTDAWLVGLLGALLPRSVDSDVATREAAVAGVAVALRSLQARRASGGADDDDDDDDDDDGGDDEGEGDAADGEEESKAAAAAGKSTRASLRSLRNMPEEVEERWVTVMGRPLTSERLSCLHDVARRVVAILPQPSLRPLYAALSAAMTDSDEDAAVGAAHALVTMIQLADDGALNSAAPMLVAALLPPLSTLSSRSDSKAQVAALACMRALAVRQFAPTTVALLAASASPLQPELKLVVRVVARANDDAGKPLIGALIAQLTSTIVKAAPTRPDGDCSQRYLASLAFLAEALSERGSVEVYAKRFMPSMFCTLLLAVGATQGLGDGQAVALAVAGLEQLLAMASSKKPLGILQSLSMSLQSVDTYDEATFQLASTFCNSCPDQAEELFRSACSTSVLARSIDSQRIIATAITTAVLAHCEDDELLPSIVAACLSRSGDTHPLVRKHVFHGLGLLHKVPIAMWADEQDSALSALMNGMDDSDNVTSATALRAVGQLFADLPADLVQPRVLNTCFRLRSTLVRDDVHVRQQATHLLAQLCACADASAVKGKFVEQLHTLLPLVIVHLHSPPRPSLRTSSLDCMKAMSALLDDDGSLHAMAEDFGDFDAFLPAFAQLLLTRFADRVDSYCTVLTGCFSSPWPSVRGSAALIVASVVAQAEAGSAAATIGTHICGELVSLLSDEEHTVRSRAARALCIIAIDPSKAAAAAAAAASPKPSHRIRRARRGESKAEEEGEAEEEEEEDEEEEEEDVEYEVEYVEYEEEEEVADDDDGTAV